MFDNLFINDIVTKNKSILEAFEQYDESTLENAMVIFDRQYEMGNELIEDPFYDEFYHAFINKFPNNALSLKIRSEFEQKPNNENLEKVIHSHPMLSTDKGYTKKDIDHWIKKIIKTAKDIEESDYHIIITPKLDGMAARYENNVLATRGDGVKGFNVTHVFDRGIVPFKGDKTEEGDGELVLSQSYFDKNLSNEFSHPRNVMVGIVKSDTLTEASIDTLESKAAYFVRYDSMECLKLKAEEILEMDNFYDYCFEQLIKNIDFDFPIDGFVAVVDNNKIREELGHNNKYHNWMLAIKTKGEFQDVEVLNISLQTGRTGRVTPVIEIPPTKISGAVIRNITGHNIKLLKEKGINKGAIIRVVRSGEVIPYVSEVIKTSNEELEVKCPSCGGDVIQISESVSECANKMNCPAQLVNSIIYHFKVLEAKNYGKSTAEKIVESGLVDNLSEVYKLSHSDFMNMGLGPRQSEILIEERQKIIDIQQKPEKIIASFGINNLGSRASKSLLAYFDFYDLVLGRININQISEIENFGEISANNIYYGIIDNQNVIRNILETGIKPEEKEVVDNNSPISGCNVVFTGSMQQGNRKDMEEQAGKLGAVVQKSVNKKTNYLIAGEKAGSKIEKANKLGIKVLTEQEYLSIIE